MSVDSKKKKTQKKSWLSFLTSVAD